ncbi:MAG: Na/Pi cotransporter family protein [Candidatus Auribacterota bacterium]|nr:Na/Pi cotransporter family protein [Candidatus Auribacterota bacterium]
MSTLLTTLATIGLPVIGGLGIFLLGMKNMSEGMQAVAGRKLRSLINAVTSHRLLACGVGIVVTCLIQSSSVTTVTVVGFVNAGLMTLAQAIGVILGANIGTTITGWLLVLKIGRYGLPILGIAALVYLFSKNERIRYTAMVIMGFGMIFFGLQLMKQGFTPLREMPGFLEWFSRFTPDSYFGVLKCALAGALLTAIIQSSSATIGITMGLASTGIINFHTAAALVLGENVGTTITAYLSSLGASRNAKLAAYAHIVINLGGALCITALFPWYIKGVVAVLGINPDLAVQTDGGTIFPNIIPSIALAHTGFNTILVIAVLPFTGLLARGLEKLIPNKYPDEPPHLVYLDIRLLNSPALGIEQSKEELLFMVDSVEKMMGLLGETLCTDKPDQNLERKIFKWEEILDNVQKEIAVFLGGLMTGNITHKVMIEAQKQIRLADEYESISDYIVSMQKMRIKSRKYSLKISEPGRRDLIDLHNHTNDYITLVSNAIRTNQDDILNRADKEHKEIVRLMKEYRGNNLARLAAKTCAPLPNMVFADMLTNYRHIAEHAINIAEVVAGEK